MSEAEQAARAPEAEGRRGARLVEVGVENSLLVVLVATLGTVLFGLAPLVFVGDTWLTLVAGREIAEQGLPQRDALAVITQGRTWTDQQWLAQLTFYGASALAGLRVTMLLHVVLVTSATAIAIVAARSRGASARSTLLVVTVCLLVAPWSWTLRTQAFALPLFVGTLALLAADRDLLRRRTLLVFPLLVLWANVHGSVVLGAAIVSLAGVIGIGELVLRKPTRATPWRCAALVVLPWLCVGATPYGSAIAGYYRLMFFDSAVANAVTEWQAPKPQGYQIVFFVVALAAVVIAFLGRRNLSLFDVGVLALTLASSLRSARGIVWFALAVSVLLPVALDAVLPPDRAPIRRRVGLVLCIGSCAMLAAALVVWVPRGDGWYESSWSRDGAKAVAAALPGVASGPAVLAGDRHADWLLWKVPDLRGRIAYDVRFELLTAAEIRALQDFEALRPGWRALVRPYRIVVLSAGRKSKRVAALLEEPGARVLYRGNGMVVVRRGG